MQRFTKGLQVWGRWAVFACVITAGDSWAACRSEALTFTARDVSLELGEYGTLFLEASTPECRSKVHDQLLRKLRLALGAPPELDPPLGRAVRPFERWLAGAHVGLAVPAAMQLAAAGFLDAPLDAAVVAIIDAYRFNIDPACGANTANACIDDYTQAAAGYAWSAAYEARSGRANRAHAFAAEARQAMHDALSADNYMCMRAADPSSLRPCDQFEDAQPGLTSGYYEILSFNHGFENVAYGIGLMTSLSSAAIALEEAGEPFVATDEEVRVAWALFREGQRATADDGSTFRSNCYRVVESDVRSDSICADSEYQPRMFPVRTFYQRAFHNAPNEDPYRFDQLDASLFHTAFINDGRFAVYALLGEQWWHLRPLLDGYRHPARARTVRH